MGFNIDGGLGGGGGITIETDPTALKIANNLGDIQDAEAARSNLGVTVGLSDAPNDGNYWCRQSGEWTQVPSGGGGTSFGVTGFSEWNVENYADLSTTGPYAGSIGTGNTLGDSVNIVCETQTIDSYRKVGLIGTTTINEGTYNASFMFGWHQFALEGSGQYGWKVDPCLIFPDGTVQYTAYTGGGGGGGITEEQRMADAIASNIVYWTYSNVDWGYVVQGTWNGANGYPSVINMAYNGWGIDIGGNQLTIQYLDYMGFTTIEATYAFGDFKVFVNDANLTSQTSFKFGSNV